MSTQVQINDVEPKTQIIATSGQVDFSTNWTANAASDVVVYARAAGVEPDDLTQVVSTTDYLVTFVGTYQTVRVTFSVGRTAGDIITIVRNTPADRLNLYTNTNFTASMLNQDIGILTLVDQQAQLYNNQVAPHYNLSSTPDLGDSFTGEGGDIYLPILGANEAWKKNSNNTAIETILFPSSGGLAPSDATYIVQTPWSPSGELPNQQALSNLATGFMTSVTATGVVSTRTLQGTANQINITNTDGTGNPAFSLSNTLVLPGTLTLGGTLNANGYSISNVGQINISNIEISGNTISSTDTNGDLILTPNGTGDLVLDGLNWPQSDGTNGQAVTTDGAGQLGWTSFGAPYTPSALTKVDDTNVTLTLGGTPATALLQAVSLTLGWSGQLSIARGGTNTNTLGSSGQLAQSDGTKYSWTTATYPSVATGAGTILRADGTNWVASTSTFADTYAASSLLYSNGANAVTGLATGNSSTLATNSSGVPTWVGPMTNGQLLIGSTGATPVAATLTAGTNIGITNAAGSITINNTSTASGQVNSGTANQLAYYATTGTAVSGLTSANSATLVTDATGVPAWTAPMTNGQLLIGSTGGTPVLGTITGTGGITVTNAAGSITISGSGGGFSWTDVTGTTQAMAVNNGYIANNASQVSLSLPASSIIGDTIKVQGKGTGGWKVTQNAGQTIYFNSATSTTGASGYIESTQRYNSVELVCITANNDWAVNSASGNLTVF